MGGGLGAHGAGLQRDIKVRAGEARLSQLPRRGTDRQQLGMRGWIMVALRAIVGARQHLATVRIDQHGADRDLPRRRGK